jgi:hypothetical protein
MHAVGAGTAAHHPPRLEATGATEVAEEVIDTRIAAIKACADWAPLCIGIIDTTCLQHENDKYVSLNVRLL